MSNQYSRPEYPPPNNPYPNQPYTNQPFPNQPYPKDDEVYHVQPDYETAQFGQKPEGSQNFDESFKIDKPRYNDWPFTILFLLVVGGFIAIAGITLNALRQTFSLQGSSIYDSPDSFTLNTNTIILFSFVIVVAIVLSAGLIIFARVAPKFFITTGLILNILLGLGTCIYYFVEHYYSAAIVFLIFTLFTAWCYWTARRRIPLSATILTIAIDVMKAYPSTLVVSFLGVVISGAFSVLFSVVLVATYVKFEPNNNNEACAAGGGGCSHAKVIGILVYVMFAGYYISEVFRNIIHVTISGVYGTWYYLANSDQGAPRLPALGALRRALTYCFGSISFGSLIVSLIQLVRSILQILRQSAIDNGEGWAACLILIVDFLVSFIEGLVRYFNHYAYCYIALYGKSYLRSAKDTFELLRYKGMDVLVNDCFINTSLNMYALFVGYLTALLSFFYLRFTSPAYNANGGYYAPVIAFAFLISGQITRVSLTVIESGISTFFVALAKDPEVFQMTNRDKFDAIFRDYPQVLQKITANH
ncbi:protein PNS1 [Scheffersomyces amazonensis]|uniref:protein PNS1 n=1 Tax=Scheffersomyces amazonensis TaxID=1078765 RepID=UPI00315DB6F6